MTDYNALGRYTDAKDKLTDLLMKRDEILRELERLAKLPMGGSQLTAGIVQNFNVAKAQELVSKLSELTGNINSTIAEINMNAEKAGKFPIKTSGD